MSTNTTNYNLKKPGVDDFYNVADQNGNMDIIDTTLANKVDKVAGKGLSTNDYTTVEKTKLSGIATGAQVNNISDANATALTNGTNTTLHYHASDRDRANHTGTQTASTISDFAAAVRTTVLTGLSTATNAVITATDTVLTALGKLQKQITDHFADNTKHSQYGATTGSANTYVLTLDPAPTALVDGLGICAKINVQNTGASTINVNGLGAKSILDSKGNAMTAGKLKANTPYTMRYNGTNFILQGEGASGTAAASDLLSGKTASVDAGDITGTMANNGAVTITPSTTNQTISAGYHNGSGYVFGDADLVAANIVSGKNIFGVDGAASNIKSVQRGIYTASLQTIDVLIPISSVDINSSIILISYSSIASGQYQGAIATMLNDASNLRLICYGGMQAGQTVSWEVIEFNNVKSLNLINIAITSNAEYVGTIPAIDLSKSLIICTNTTNSASGIFDMKLRARLINSTSYGILKSNAISTVNVLGQIIEFK